MCPTSCPCAVEHLAGRRQDGALAARGTRGPGLHAATGEAAPGTSGAYSQPLGPASLPGGDIGGNTAGRERAEEAAETMRALLVPNSRGGAGLPLQLSAASDRPVEQGTSQALPSLEDGQVRFVLAMVFLGQPPDWSLNLGAGLHFFHVVSDSIIYHLPFSLHPRLWQRLLVPRVRGVLRRAGSCPAWQAPMLSMGHLPPVAGEP